MTFKMQIALDVYLDKIREDYRQGYKGRMDNATSVKMIKEFENGLIIKKGKKYLKVVVERIEGGSRVHSFISLGGDKFKEGDILLPETWFRPAKNKARGNIYEDYQIKWTGPDYLPTGLQKQ